MQGKTVQRTQALECLFKYAQRAFKGTQPTSKVHAGPT